MSRPGIAVVTGAASGVGRAVSEMLRASNHDVIGVDLKWPEASPGDITQVEGSVSDWATWNTVARLIESRGAPVEKLVINAAKLVVGAVLDVSEEDFSLTLDINVLGALYALKTCLPGMVEARMGSIVAVASVDALLVEQDLSAYCTSKGALLQLVRSVAVDYGHKGIRANSVCPGAINTPFFRQHVEAAADPDEFLRVKTARHPSGRILEAEDVAAAVMYLLGQGAVGVNGTELVVDGGLTATFDYHPPE